MIREIKALYVECEEKDCYYFEACVLAGGGKPPFRPDLTAGECMSEVGIICKSYEKKKTLTEKR